MARDDYFRLVYLILTRMYKALKEGKPVDRKYISDETFGIPYSYWANILVDLSRKELISGVTVKENIIGEALVDFHNPRITYEGVEYLNENGMMKKVQKHFQEAKEYLDLVHLLPL